jgi:ankyrin repeat protein
MGDGTALMAAASEGQTDIVNLLLEKGADFRHKSATGKTALEIAAQKEETAIAFAQKAAESTANDAERNSFFLELLDNKLLIAYPRFLEFLHELLLDFGADANTKRQMKKKKEEIKHMEFLKRMAEKKRKRKNKKKK